MNKYDFQKPTWLIIIGLVILGMWITPGCSKVEETAVINPTLPLLPEVTPSATLQLVSTPEATFTEEATPIPTPVPLERV